MVEGSLLDDEALLALGPRQAAETQPEAEAARPPGTCHICRTRLARIACRGCGLPACATDSWAMFGLCSACASETSMRRWHAKGQVEERNWLEEGR
ncbi:MAG TPA: hypothetical protein VI796_00855 [Candidatus Thermoplasmatota archaeon]|nr:hypothetical protein [Candidatus Thermoplasmatota archaeon]